MTADSSTTRGFTLTRLLDAPRALVFQAWTDPHHLHWFFNPSQHTAEPIQLDLRVGGAWRQTMIIDEGTEYVTGGIYREIVPVERLVFTFGATDGWPTIDPARLDDSPLVTLNFAERGEKTEMSLQVTFSDRLSEERVREWLASGMQEGWGITIDRLVARFAGRGEQH
jgi:uncharacterized protein YndB with AHSA1/START domain